MAHSPRGWTGARSPQALKRVRQAARKRAINQPRRSAAKTLVTRAVTVAGTGVAEDAVAALQAAVSALDKAAKVGAIHKNAADRRKSRLMRKVNAALGGDAVTATATAARTTGKAAAAKAAKARVAASRASKAKGEQTAAGKARAALTRTTRETNRPDAPAGDAAAAGSTTRGTSGDTTIRTRTTTRTRAASAPAAPSGDTPGEAPAADAGTSPRRRGTRAGS